MNTRTLIVLVAALSAVFAQNLNRDDQLFNGYQNILRQAGKAYSASQLADRFEIFKQTAQEIAQSQFGYIEELNKFSDLTHEEFQQQYLTFRVRSSDEVVLRNLPILPSFPSWNIPSSFPSVTPSTRPSTNPSTPSTPSTKPSTTPSTVPNTTPSTSPSSNSKTAPESWDWRSQNAVTAVKDQGSCGVCWAFSTVANIEGLYSIKNGQSVRFSEEQLLDCDNTNSGCNGGSMQSAMTFLKNNGGLQTEADYPWSGSKTVCKFNSARAVAKVSGYARAEADEEKIKQTLWANGPLAAAVDATNLQSYKSGIYTCGSKSNWKMSELNHGITIVGYGVEQGKKYWIIKNSWGKNWGEQGYFKLARGTNSCGINLFVLSATLA